MNQLQEHPRCIGGIFIFLNLGWSYKEIDLLKFAEINTPFCDCTVRAYGLIRGPLPDHLAAMFKMRNGVEETYLVASQDERMFYRATHSQELQFKKI